MKGIVKSQHIDILGLKIQLAQALAHLRKSENILREISNKLSYIALREEINAQEKE